VYANTIPLSGFTLTNTNADGMVTTLPDDSGFTLTGGNNGSGLVGETDFAIPSPGSFTVSFLYAYSTLDFPFFDHAGYQVGGVQVLLAEMDGDSGSATFAVSPGQSFGWWIVTDDNLGEPGVLDVSRITYTGSVSAVVPEPHAFLLFALGIILLRVLREPWHPEVRR